MFFGIGQFENARSIALHQIGVREQMAHIAEGDAAPQCCFKPQLGRDRIPARQSRAPLCDQRVTTDRHIGTRRHNRKQRERRQRGTPEPEIARPQCHNF